MLVAFVVYVFIFLISEDLVSRISIVVDLILLIVLIGVTVYYALKTKEIADGTRTLAEQAALQRQRDFLPIIDIIKARGGAELTSTRELIKKGEFPDYIPCDLSNVGRGPAFNCTYQAVDSSEPLVQPTFLVGQTVNKGVGLFLKVETESDGSHFLRVSYLDAFGNNWTSSKAVLKDKNEYLLGHLCFKKSD